MVVAESHRIVVESFVVARKNRAGRRRMLVRVSSMNVCTYVVCKRQKNADDDTFYYSCSIFIPDRSQKLLREGEGGKKKTKEE